MRAFVRSGLEIDFNYLIMKTIAEINFQLFFAEHILYKSVFNDINIGFVVNKVCLFRIRI